MIDIEIFDIAKDEVIDSFVGNGKTNYSTALQHLYPLINRFSAQRKIQDQKFYQRLKRDILEGCLMPPLTIAFVDKDSTQFRDAGHLREFIDSNLKKGYILDGIQRLNTLNSAQAEKTFNDARPLYFSVIIAPSQDKLLYRMITLNNGQRPMTPRHQIEILTQELFDFDDLNIDVQSEKERSEKIVRGAFNLGDISKAYLAFLTHNVHNDNTKIVDEKMDQILVGRILDTDIKGSSIEFRDILGLIDNLCENRDIKKWLKVNNNLIGFSVGIRSSYEYIHNLPLDQVAESLDLFEKGFSAINASKVNLGKYRRELSREFIDKFEDLSNKDEEELLEYFIEITA
ncbi:hypothetical protein VB780_30635 [Leptolyngbya sp. CCNP1308]|uniref:hypothetical protein n=1 Tax=Leptolyngbya sp. CCNP1308 TaxID=3110255 RepID=UPI002B219F80|nr:hypothetical protein [Leptolyngbya sp. CCNP1308]MEA5452968.1 hypothetical protein [Leptolyngbya sp. CCNP1308]